MVIRKPSKRFHNNDGEGFLNNYTLTAIYEEDSEGVISYT